MWTAEEVRAAALSQGGLGMCGGVGSAGSRRGEECLRLHDRAHSEAWWSGKLGAKQGQRVGDC